MNIQRVLCCAFIALMIVNATVSKAAILSGPVVNPGNGHTYYLLDNVLASNVPNPFDAGQAEAQTLGGNLATINDAAEDAWVFSTFDAIADAADPASNRKSLLVGLNDVATEGTFVWVSGEPLSYTNWNPAQPQSNTPGEDYVGIALTSNAFIDDGKWHDIDFANGDVVYAVVEVVPEPTTGTLALAAVGLFSLIPVVRRRRR